VQQIASCYTVDSSEALLGACTGIYVSHEIEQSLIGMVSDGTQTMLVRLVLAGIIELLLKFAESVQPVVLLRKPRMQCVHDSLFK
jgi:hypothetical protein